MGRRKKTDVVYVYTLNRRMYAHFRSDTVCSDGVLGITAILERRTWLNHKCVNKVPTTARAGAERLSEAEWAEFQEIQAKYKEGLSRVG